MATPKRVFEGEAGQRSVGIAGPVQLMEDLDKAFAMFDPADEVEPGVPGGIGPDNLQPGSIDDVAVGERTANPALAPANNGPGTLTEWFSWIVNRFRAILGGGLNWWQAPPSTLTEGRAHIDAATGVHGVGGSTVESVAGSQAKVDTHNALTSPHSAVSVATASRLIVRDVNSRARVAAPAHNDDIARKLEVDTVQGNLNTHTGLVNNPHTVTATQVGVPVSVDGVDNPGGDINLIAGTNIDIVSNNVAKTITISTPGGTIDAHRANHEVGGADRVRLNNLEMQNDVVLGAGTVLDGDNGLVIGRDALAGNIGSGAGDNHIAIGHGATTQVDNAANRNSLIAIGLDAAASNTQATAVGRNAVASGLDSLAVGDGASATAEGAVALGKDAAASGNYSAAIGAYSSATAANEFVLGGSTHNVKVPGVLELERYSETVTTADTGTTYTIDLEDGSVFNLTLTGNCTFTFSNPPASGKAGSFTLILKQDGTGDRTTTWPATVEWANGLAPTLVTTANAINILTFFTVDGGAVWFGMLSGVDFS